MAPSTTIGAASVVGSGGADLPDTLADKINNSNAAKIKDLAAAHNRNTEWAEAAVRDAASVSAAEAVAMDPPVVDLVATRRGRPLRPDRLRPAGRRAALRVRGRAAAAALRPAGPGREHEPGPVVPARAVRPEHRLHPVHHRLLRDRQRAVPPELLLRAGGRHCAGAGLHRLQQPAAEPGRAAADPARHRALHPGAARDLVRPPDHRWGDRHRARRLRAVDRGRPAAGRDQRLDQPMAAGPGGGPVAGLRVRHRARADGHAKPPGPGATGDGPGGRRRRGPDADRAARHRLRGR